MKNYMIKFSILTIFVFVMFFGAISKADAAISLSFGFGSNSYSSYGYNTYNPYNNYNNSYYGNTGYNNRYNNYYNTPINCFTSGYPCGGTYYYPNNGMNYYNSYNPYAGYYSNNLMSNTYNGGGYYNEYNPVRTTGTPINNNMCSYWATNC